MAVWREGSMRPIRCGFGHEGKSHGELGAILERDGMLVRRRVGPINARALTQPWLVVRSAGRAMVSVPRRSRRTYGPAKRKRTAQRPTPSSSLDT
jgi:hypothetical protein